MKSKYVLIAFVLFCCSCQELIMKNRPFPAVDAGRIEIVPISEEKGEIIKVTNEIGENIPASKLIEDFFYVPLESIEESLFAYCNQIEVFEDKIFVFDRTGTEKLFIFRKNGKFLKSIGEKGAPPFSPIDFRNLPFFLKIKSFSVPVLSNTKILSSKTSI